MNYTLRESVNAGSYHFFKLFVQVELMMKAAIDSQALNVKWSQLARLPPTEKFDKHILSKGKTKLDNCESAWLNYQKAKGKLLQEILIH
jgi:hypothetical protein